MTSNNILPIQKIVLASMAFILTHWRVLLKISLIPVFLALPFFMILPELSPVFEQVFSKQPVDTIVLPNNTFIYGALFLYAYITLFINIIYLFTQANLPIKIVTLVPLRQIVRFIGMSLLIGLVSILPSIVSKIGLLQPIMAFLTAPLMLNFINIANNKTSVYKWGLSFPVHGNLFLLQIILPAIIVMLFSFVFNALGAPSILLWIVKILVFYWSAISLVICYQQIKPNKA
jgi:hypothetical protein